jgi:hypothetical protein
MLCLAIFAIAQFDKYDVTLLMIIRTYPPRQVDPIGNWGDSL